MSLPIPGLKSPGALATDAQGNLYIVDAGNGAIKKWDGKSVVSLVPGLVSPAGVAVGTHGIIYFVDSSLGNIQFFDPATGNLTVLAKNLPGIKSIAADARGNLYIVDPVQGAIVTGDPSVSTVQAVTLATGISKTAVLTVDGQGNIYISDSSAVQRFSAAGQTLTTVAVPPNDVPAQMAADPQGNLYRAGAALEQIAFGYLGPVNMAVTSAQGTGSVQVVPPTIPVSPPTASQPWLSIARPGQRHSQFQLFLELHRRQPLGNLYVAGANGHRNARWIRRHSVRDEDRGWANRSDRHGLCVSAGQVGGRRQLRHSQRRPYLPGAAKQRRRCHSDLRHWGFWL